MKPVLLWDLDGTLTDPKIGIISSIQYALKECNFKVPEFNELLWCIGPSLYESFPIITGTKEQSTILALVDKYRERFAKTGMYENEIIANIPEALQLLSHKPQYVATAKPHVFANEILRHFNLLKNFKKVYGSELDGTRTNKGDLILYLLEQEGINAKDAVIIGDREHDIKGAKKAGISSIGITWGYGSQDELKNAGADAVFTSPLELANFLK